jgi:hypothetical protein
MVLISKKMDVCIKDNRMDYYSVSYNKHKTTSEEKLLIEVSVINVNID